MKTFVVVLFLRILEAFFPLKIVSSAKDKKQFTRLWRRIWLEEHYAGEEEPIVAHYEKYDSFSIDFMVKFLGIIPVATMRLIWDNSEARTPTLTDFDITAHWGNNDKIMEATLLTVDRKFRGATNFPFVLLMKALYLNMCKTDTKILVVGADQRLFRLLTKRSKMPFKRIGPEKFYEGSITIPAYVSRAGLYESFGVHHPMLRKFICKE